jgi:cupin superfamily acireductone dioxygenase involved in methionine salvage
MAQKMADEKGYKHVDLVSVSPKIGSDKVCSTTRTTHTTHATHAINDTTHTYMVECGKECGIESGGAGA